MAHRITQRRETQLVAEYLAERVFPNWYVQGQPLGPALEGLTEAHGVEKALRISRPWRPEVDAVTVEDGRLVLIEGKIFKWRDGMGQLPLYKAAVPSTPELAEHRGKLVVLRLLMPWTSPMVELLAQATGVEVVVFAPAWVEEYTRSYHQYWTPEYRERRDQMLEMRRQLGVE
jgi:hypothetical protein